MARLLGARSLTVAQPQQGSPDLQLSGVIAHPDGHGIALIGPPGQPAHSYVVGSAVREGLWLQSVGTRKAELGADKQGGARQVLELPSNPDK